MPCYIFPPINMYSVDEPQGFQCLWGINLHEKYVLSVLTLVTQYKRIVVL